MLPEYVAKRDAPVRTHDLWSYDRKPDRQPDQQPDLQPDQQPDHPRTHRRAPMNDITTPAALREQAAALRLHGLIEHWAEVMA